MSEFDEYIKNKYPSDYLLMTVRYPDQDLCELYPDQFEVWEHQGAKIDELKVKNTQLIHALVNANAEKSKWAKDYWQQVERCAEYGAMLMADPDSLEFKIYQKEKQNEELTKQLRALTSQLNNMEQCYSGKKKECDELQSQVDRVLATMQYNLGHNDYEDMRNPDYHTMLSCLIEIKSLFKKPLRGEHE